VEDFDQPDVLRTILQNIFRSYTVQAACDAKVVTEHQRSVFFLSYMYIMFSIGEVPTIRWLDIFTPVPMISSWFEA
jgi:hypothetical protein